MAILGNIFEVQYKYNHFLFWRLQEIYFSGLVCANIQDFTLNIDISCRVV